MFDYIASKGVHVEFNTRLLSYEETEKGVVVYAEDGSSQKHIIEADILVAADGAASRIRAQAIGGEVKLDFRGYTAWRGTVAKEDYEVRKTLERHCLCAGCLGLHET